MIAKSTASQIYNLGGTYTTLPNESLLAIRDAAAIGVWAYLVSKNESWRLERTFLCEELGLKTKQYHQILNRLKVVGLAREYCVRKNGRLHGKEIVIVSAVSDWLVAEAKLQAAGDEKGLKFVDITASSIERATAKAKEAEEHKAEKSNTELSAGENSVTAKSLLYNKEIKEREIKEEAKGSACAADFSDDSFLNSSSQPEAATTAADIPVIPKPTEPPTASLTSEVPVDEQVIGERLSDFQHEFVKRKLALLMQGASESEFSKYLQGVVYDLESKTVFTEADDDFLKKANTIFKLIRLKRWHIPRALEKTLLSKQQSEQKARSIELSKLVGERDSIDRMLNYTKPDATGQRESLLQQLKAVEHRIHAFTKNIYAKTVSNQGAASA